MGKFFGIIDGENLVIQDVFSDGGDKLWVSYEGEIYNYDEIRLSLEALGYRFNSDAYSGLIAKAYKAWGEDFAKRLNGAFSICIIDKEKEILYLIRDQVGRKPLYFSDVNGRFAFSSDVKSLLEIPRFPREIDLRALNFYLTYRYIPQELSIFNHIRKLPAGCALRLNLRSRKIKKWSYWEPPTVEERLANENELLRGHFSEPEMYGTSTMNSNSGTLNGKMAFLTFKSDPDDILFKIDKICRNLSLNVRTPFLDTRLVEFALRNVPGNMKIRGSMTKYILKRLATKFLPPELPLDRKRGFNPPVSKWLRNEWWNYARDFLMEGDENFFNKGYIAWLFKRHKSILFEEGRRLFCLLNFKVWEKGDFTGDGLRK